MNDELYCLNEKEEPNTNISNSSDIPDITTDSTMTNISDSSNIIEGSDISDINTDSTTSKLSDRSNIIEDSDISDITSDNSSNISKSCSNLEIINNNCDEAIINSNQLKEIKSYLLNQNFTENIPNTIITSKNIIIQLSTIEDQSNLDNYMVSNIDFGECEQLLKKVNGLDPSESLIVYKTDIKSQDLSTTYVQYEVYNPYTLEQLNLSICSDIFINIDIPVILNEKLDSLNHNSNSFGYNIFDENDPLYQDICAKYTTLEGTDMLLSDRTKDIYTESQSQSI
jgi:hypothetical protein